MFLMMDFAEVKDRCGSDLWEEVRNQLEVPGGAQWGVDGCA